MRCSKPRGLSSKSLRARILDTPISLAPKHQLVSYQTNKALLRHLLVFVGILSLCPRKVKTVWARRFPTQKLMEGPLKNAELLKSDTKIIARPGNVADLWTVTQGAPYTRLQMNASSLLELNRWSLYAACGRLNLAWATNMCSCQFKILRYVVRSTSRTACDF